MVAICITLAVSLAGFVFAADILRLMGAEPATVTFGVNYTRILMGGSIVIMLLFLINGIFRGAGDAGMAMKSLWLANICNIILCPLLIRGLWFIPPFGLMGAAMATTLGRAVGVSYQLYHLVYGKGQVKIRTRHITFDWKLMKSIIAIASPATIQFIIASCSWIFLARLVAEMGHEEASAGYQIAIRVFVFFILPAWGLSNAASTLVGQNLGAKQPDRAEKSVIKTAKYNAIFMALVTVFFLLFTDQVISFFTTNENIKAYAEQAIRIVSCGYIFYGIGMVLSNAFNGAGDTVTPTWINFVCFWLFQIPLAYILAKVIHLGVTGVFIAIPISETALTISYWVLFKRGKWKEKVV